MDLRRPLAVITPTLDGDVLALLAAGDVRLSGRDIGRRIGASQEGARHVLERLVAQGIVVREKAGNAHLYHLNHDHLAAPWIARLSAMRTELIDRLRAKIRGWSIAPAAAVLFGSTARGDTGPNSDIDIAVVRAAAIEADEPAWGRQVTNLVRIAKAMTGNDARVVEYSEQEVRRLGSSDKLLAAAAADGIELAGSLRALVSGRPRRRSRR